MKSKIHCPLCDDVYTEVRENMSWRCVNCGSRLLASTRPESAEALFRAEQAYKFMISKRGGGSKSSRRARKKYYKPKPPYILE